MGTLHVLSPAAESKVSQSAPLPLPADLGGKTVAFLDNTKANLELLAREMAGALSVRHGVARVVFERKANSASPAPPEVLDAVAAADLVITGSAD
jgi:2-phospho-L-lactate transferase/gluconeogenesis factor (CofD/UPF0052 family)